MSEVFIHKNGAGTILGHEGAVGSDCYICPASRIEGRTFVSYGSSIARSLLCDTSLSASEVENSAIVSGQIASAIISNSALESVVVRGNGRRAIVENSVLANKVVVEGCRVRNTTLEGPYLLHADIDKTPRHFLMEEQGVRLGVVECGCRPGVKSAIIGCCCRSLDLWIERRELLRRVFQKRGWSGHQIDIFHELFQEWQS